MAEEVKVSTVEEILENTTIADVYKAAKQLDGVAKKTKLIESPFFSDLFTNSQIAFANILFSFIMMPIYFLLTL